MLLENGQTPEPQVAIHVLQVINVMVPALKPNAQAATMLHPVQVLVTVVLAEVTAPQVHQAVQAAQANGPIAHLVLQADVQVAAPDISFQVAVACLILLAAVQAVVLQAVQNVVLRLRLLVKIRVVMENVLTGLVV